ncbi:MAG: serine/threonine-protein kinase, partial [Polyangiales bacterium]
MAFEAGLLLGSRFRLVNRIGEGALGELWRGTDRSPTKQVAIRLVTPRVPVVRNALDTFVAESRIAMSLRHPSVGRVIAVGQTEEGVPWVASELLRAETLEALLERRTLSSGAALRLVADLAEVLAESHGLGLVHRGIDPRAIMLHRGADGSVTVKLMDFGRERLLSSKLSPDWNVLPYQSPELAFGARPDKESDIWSLGVLLFRCVTGRLPFTSSSPGTFAMQTRAVDQVLEEGVEDPVVRRVVEECLRPQRDARIDAALLADRARLAGWSTKGGWSELEKMVRIPEAFLDPERFGEIVHCQTIPGFTEARASSAVAPPVVVTEPVVPVMAVAAPSLPAEVAIVPAVRSAPPAVSEPPVVRSEPPIVSEPPVAISVAHPRAPVTSIVDFQAGWSPFRKRAALVAAAAVVAAFAGAATRSTTARRPHAAGPRVVVAHEPAKQVEPPVIVAPVPTVVAVVATVAPVAPTPI